MGAVMETGTVTGVSVPEVQEGGGVGGVAPSLSSVGCYDSVRVQLPPARHANFPSPAAAKHQQTSRRGKLHPCGNL